MDVYGPPHPLPSGLNGGHPMPPPFPPPSMPAQMHGAGLPQGRPFGHPRGFNDLDQDQLLGPQSTLHLFLLERKPKSALPLGQSESWEFVNVTKLARTQPDLEQQYDEYRKKSAKAGRSISHDLKALTNHFRKRQIDRLIKQREEADPMADWSLAALTLDKRSISYRKEETTAMRVMLLREPKPYVPPRPVAMPVIQEAFQKQKTPKDAMLPKASKAAPTDMSDQMPIHQPIPNGAHKNGPPPHVPSHPDRHPPQAPPQQGGPQMQRPLQPNGPPPHPNQVNGPHAHGAPPPQQPRFDGGAPPLNGSRPQQNHPNGPPPEHGPPPQHHNLNGPHFHGGAAPNQAHPSGPGPEGRALHEESRGYHGPLTQHTGAPIHPRDPYALPPPLPPLPIDHLNNPLNPVNPFMPQAQVLQARELELLPNPRRRSTQPTAPLPHPKKGPQQRRRKSHGSAHSTEQDSDQDSDYSSSSSDEEHDRSNRYRDHHHRRLKHAPFVPQAHSERFDVPRKGSTERAEARHIEDAPFVPVERCVGGSGKSSSSKHSSHKSHSPRMETPTMVKKHLKHTRKKVADWQHGHPDSSLDSSWSSGSTGGSRGSSEFTAATSWSESTSPTSPKTLMTQRRHSLHPSSREAMDVEKFRSAYRKQVRPLPHRAPTPPQPRTHAPHRYPDDHYWYEDREGMHRRRDDHFEQDPRFRNYPYPHSQSPPALSPESLYRHRHAAEERRDEHAMLYGRERDFRDTRSYQEKKRRDPDELNRMMEIARRTRLNQDNQDDYPYADNQRYYGRSGRY